ncbi:MAG: 4-hydroxy-2-oxovalerate aldolase [Opitutaceae bacterium]|jgi:4-hydroxy-2-oxoheptanedioate aldolase|nr:4-hydroxy-2-oxovalerate aldolase [Opitutaceae bacterium]
MRSSKTLAKMRAGEVIRVCNLGHYIPGYVCHAAKAGYDCIWLDMEHRAFSTREVQALLAYSHVYDIDIMARPPTKEMTGIYRFLEDGAAGLLVPFVNSAEEARQLVRAAKFPPIGERGLDNAGFDSDFMSHSIEDYVAWASRETFLAVQIETPDAVRQIDEIAAVEGVDIIFVGPGDLGLRLKLDQEFDLDESWDRVAAACKQHGTAFGGPVGSPADMKKRRDQGAQMLIGNGEFMNWATALADSASKFEGL